MLLRSLPRRPVLTKFFTAPSLKEVERELATIKDLKELMSTVDYQRKNNKLTEDLAISHFNDFSLQLVPFDQASNTF